MIFLSYSYVFKTQIRTETKEKVKEKKYSW